MCIGRGKPAETVTSGELLMLNGIPEVNDEFFPTGDSAVKAGDTSAAAATLPVPVPEVTFPPETLEKKKRRLVAYEESFINDDFKLSLFEQWYRDNKYDVDNDLYQAWLIFKRSAAGTPKEALNHVLQSRIPKKVPKSRKKRKTDQPDGINRNIPLSYVSIVAENLNFLFYCEC